MVYVLIAFILLLIFVFMPFPVVTTFIFIDGRAELYLFRFKINLYGKNKETKNVVKGISKKDGKIKKKIKKLGFQKMIAILHNLYTKLTCSRFKIRVKSDVKLRFGLTDAAYTAILYGLTQNISPLIYKTLDTMFKLKKFNFNVEPDFQNPTLKIKINSIFFISLANVIYMVYILYKYLMLPIKK